MGTSKKGTPGVTSKPVRKARGTSGGNRYASLSPPTTATTTPFDVCLRTRSQSRILEELDDAIVSLKRWDGKAPSELEHDDTFKAVYKDWRSAMIRAIRDGHKDHPAVQVFIRDRRALGDWDTLRDCGCGLEKGVKQFNRLYMRPSPRPLPRRNDLLLYAEIFNLKRDYEEQHRKVLTQSQALRLLVAKGVLPEMSRQAFHKILKRLNLLHYFRRRGRSNM